MKKTKIKIGGVECNLEDMPPAFANAIKNKMKEEQTKDETKDIEKISEKIKDSINSDSVKNIEKNTENIETNKKSLFRKCFGYKSGILDSSCKRS